MTSLLLALVLASPASNVIPRDSYGVPLIKATSIRQAWQDQGFSAAEDRMWQMEMSRHLARGTLASILGPSALASDTEVARTGYTSDELQAQYERLSPFAKEAMDGYAEGVTRFIQTHRLPAEFAAAEDNPKPWTPLDSTAICVRLFQEFGRGGAGELRNLAFIQYAKNQPKLKDRYLDALDDFAWQNDPAAVTTLSVQDDVLAANPPVIFALFDRATTAARLEEIPLPSLFELLPAVQLAERTDSHLLAEKLSTPFRTGSYCVVVSPQRSRSGNALLVSGPQMGFTTPSILHEVSIDAPGLHINGADVPGVPGVVVGKTHHFAWGVTSGEADTEDIVWSKTNPQGYVHEGKSVSFTDRSVEIEVKGQSAKTVTSKWTAYGPVVLDSPSQSVAFSRHSAYRGQELRSFDALLSTYDKQTAAEIDRAISPATMNFNYFYATTSGDIGYRYLGLIPERAAGLDPRLPTPDESKYAWKGFVPASQMPHALNPKTGLIANWNNKPTSWWPNGDTPSWGRVHQANTLFAEVKRQLFSPQDLAAIVENIAKADDTWPSFKEFAPAFDGRLTTGTFEPVRYQRWFDILRHSLIEPVAGQFLSRDVFNLVAQPTLVWNALHGKTRLDFLAGRSADEIASECRKVEAESEFVRETGPPVYRPSSATFKNIGQMPYSNRGTYIQIVELRKADPQGRSCLPPGESATTPHSADQLLPANHWYYKAMH